MKGAKPEIISASLFQFHKISYHVNDVETAEDLLYGILCDQGSLYPDCEYKLSGHFI